MADNASVNTNTAATGATNISVATDNIGGIDYQRTKLVWGVDGTATDASASDPLPTVQTGALPAGSAVIGKVSIDQTTDGTTNLVAAKQSGTWNVGSITTLPALVAGTAIIGKVGIDQTTDGTTNLVAAKQSGTWSTGLTAGTAVVGKFGIDQTTDGTTNLVAAKQSGTWNIGSITTLPALVAGTAVVGKFGIDQTTDGTTNLVAAKQSGAWSIGLSAGSALVGKFGIDQTTDGTTNKVVAKIVDSTGTALDYTVPSLVEGGTAHDSAMSTRKPVAIGGLAKTANPTAVADGDVTHTMHDKLGKLISVPAVRDLKGRQATTITSSTTETTIVTAGGAGVFRDVYGLIIANTSASACEVTIRDVTAGGTATPFEVPAGDTRGFMVDAGSAVPQGTANSAWTATCGTSVDSIKITALYVANT